MMYTNIMSIDWTNLVEKYKGKWIALESDEKTVVGSGTTLSEAIQQAKSKGVKEPVVTKVPTKIIPYIS